MSVDVSTTQSPVAVSVNDTTVSVVVSGGIGPQGPSGAASPATTSTLGGIIVGSNLTVTADGTLSATGGGAVSSVAGRTGAVTLTTADVSGLATVATSGSAADLTGTLSDARLSDAVALAATVATMNHGSATAIDTVARNIVAVAYQGTSNNTIYWMFFTPQVTLTVGNISMCTGSSASTSLTAVIMALYTFDETTYTMVARTASDTTLFNAISTLYTKPFDTATGYPATYTLQKGVRYGVGLWMQGSTFPTMAGAAVNSQVHALSPRVSGYRGSQSSIPTTGTVFSGIGPQIWSRLT